MRTAWYTSPGAPAVAAVVVGVGVVLALVVVELVSMVVGVAETAEEVPVDDVVGESVKHKTLETIPVI